MWRVLIWSCRFDFQCFSLYKRIFVHQLFHTHGVQGSITKHCRLLYLFVIIRHLFFGLLLNRVIFGAPQLPAGILSRALARRDILQLEVEVDAAAQSIGRRLGIQRHITVVATLKRKGMVNTR